MSDNFVSQSWKCHNLDGHSFVSKYYYDGNVYKLILTDGINLWFESLNNSEINTRLKELNEFETPLDNLMSLIEKTVKFECILNVQRADNQITIETELHEPDSIPFTWNFQLRNHDKEMFADHLTFPFISMMIEQQSKIKELIKIIYQKDDEITDYKLSGVTLTRARLETRKFNETSFMKELQSTEDDFSTNSPIQSLIKNNELHTLYQTITQTVQLKNGPPPKETHELVNDSVTPQKPNPETPSETPESNEMEIKRREALKRRLAQEEKKKEAKKKQKKLVRL